MAQFVKVARKSELPEYEGTLVEGIGSPVQSGRRSRMPWHGSRFDIRTGEVTSFPATEDDVEVEV